MANLRQRPILYSFRRCPYAMRARLAIIVSGVECELREVSLKDKPPAMLRASPKGTVPVLLVDDIVIEESIEIAQWALSQNDPEFWLLHSLDHSLIQKADTQFKPQLDRYKYADRYPEYSEQDYFDQAQPFLLELEEALSTNDSEQSFLLAQNATVLDAMIFPFVRQFASVNRARFDALSLLKLHRWLDYWLESPLFKSIMFKYSPWSGGESLCQNDIIVFGGNAVENLP